MFSSKEPLYERSVCAVRCSPGNFKICTKGRWPMKKYIVSLVFITGLASLLTVGLSVNLRAAVNAYFTGSEADTLQSELLAHATNQYQATVTKSPYFNNTWTLNVSGRNPTPPPPPPVQGAPKDWQTQLDITTTTLSALLPQFVKVSSDSYFYGWTDGVMYERTDNLNVANQYYVNCSSQTYFDNYPSTGPWNNSVCQWIITSIFKTIMNKSFPPPPAPAP